MIDWLGDLIGIEGLRSVVSFHMEFAALWAENRGVLVLLLCLAAGAISVVFYVRYQGMQGRKA